MALDFPNSPTNGQIFSSGTKKWTWSTAEGFWLASNYAPSPENVNGIVKCNGAGNFSAAVAGTDYLTSATSGFTQSLANNGWQRLPSGLIIQWFSWPSTTDAGQTITFPQTFTDAFSVTFSHALGGLSLSNSSVTVNRINGIEGTVTMYGIAVGI